VQQRGVMLKVLSAVAIAAAGLIPIAAAGQTPALTAIVVARGVTDGRPVDPGSVFPADAKIFITFRHNGLAEGTEIQSVWYRTDDAGPLIVGEVSTTIRGQSGTADLSLAPRLASWKEGAYHVVLMIDAQEAGTAHFSIASRSGATAPAVSAPAPLASPPPVAVAAKPSTGFVFTPAPSTASPAPTVAPSAAGARARSGFSATPPDGWTIDASVAGVEMRMTPARGDGVIDVSSSALAPGADAMAMAAAWEAAAVGRGKTFTVRLRSDQLTIAGQRAYVAVYAGPASYCKVVFIPTNTGGVIVTGTFAIANFSAGEQQFDRMISSATLR